jgi:HK97 family phage major capsid protein
MWKQLKAAKEERGAIHQKMKNLMEKSTAEKRDLNEQEAGDFENFTKQLEAKDAEIRRLETVCGYMPQADKQGNGDDKRQQPGRENSDPEAGKPIFEARDLADYSILRAINLRAQNLPLNGLEREVSDEIAKRSGKQPQGFYIPTELTLERRALDLTTGAGLKPTIHDPTNFIELLRARTLVAQFGARLLTGLTGDLSVPKQTAGATAQWVAEGASPTGSNPTVGQVSLAPKTVSAYIDITRKFILQSSMSAEQFVRDELTKVVAVEVDRTALNGSGVGNEPQGILQNGSVNTVAIGANGGAPTFAHFVQQETNVAAGNADIGKLGYITNSKVRGTLKQTLEAATAGAQMVWRPDSTVNGYRAGATNLIPSNLTKGSGTNLSAAIFGNWDDLIIAMWGQGLDLLVDPYTLSSSGGVRVVALQDCDVKLRRTESFSKIVDAIAA